MNDDSIPLVDVLEQQRRVADNVGVPSIRRHIFLCCDQTKPNCSTREQSLAAWEYLKSRLKELGLAGSGGIYRTKANCLRICRAGRSPWFIPRAPGTAVAIRRFWKRSSKST